MTGISQRVLKSIFCYNDKSKILMLKMQKSKLLKQFVALALLIAVLTPAIASAATLLSQTYEIKESLPVGSIASLVKNSTDQVDSALTTTSSSILGVVVDDNSSQLSISSKQGKQVHVATNGIEQVLVSDINGDIKSGDSITSSPIKGVGMKATNNVKIVGVAQDSFPNGTAEKQTFKDAKGKQDSVMLGQVPVLINVVYYYKQPDKTLIPSAIQNIADALAGKKVNPLPIIISVGIFLVTLIFVASIVYSMIHSSIISVGRNPMSQAAIYRNVMQLSALVVAILGVAVGSIYMVLTRF